MSLHLARRESGILRQIAGYELTDFIDSGGGGQVFRGRLVRDAAARSRATRPLAAELPDIAAIKLLNGSSGVDTSESADLQRRFEREAGVLRRLTHPHILSVIDAGRDEESGCFYMILPFMEGGNLATALTSRGVPPLTAVASLLAQLAGALDFAHDQGIVHRDVKPANILLDAGGAPYLGDFGIVRMLAGGVSEQTTIGRVLGSPAYMAPEQFSSAERAGPLADLYSLGMVIYQMVTGHVAFAADSLPALMYKQLTERPVTPRLERPDLPEAAAAAILNTLEKDPRRRFASAAAFAEAFTLGAQGQWADDLAGYRASATVSATIFGPFTASAGRAMPDASTETGAAAPGGEPAWSNDLTATISQKLWQKVRPWRGSWERVHSVVAVALLLLACLAGLGALDASGSARRPAPQTSANAATLSVLPLVVRLTGAPPASAPPRPAASQTHSGGKGSGGGHKSHGSKH